MPRDPIAAPARESSPRPQPAAPAASGAPCRPWLTLVRERVLRESAGPRRTGPTYEEIEAAALRLRFDYGGVVIDPKRAPAAFAAGDAGFGSGEWLDFDPELEALLHGGSSQAGDGAGLRAAAGVQRDPAGERAARRLLESFGPVELDDEGDCARMLGSDVDYVIDVDGDPDALAQFMLVAVPRLRAAGWRVDIAADYPAPVVQAERFFAALAPDRDEPDWFELELGVEVDGQRVDLLPILVSILESGSRLESLERTRRPAVAVPLQPRAGGGPGRLLAIPPERLRTMVRIVRALWEVEGVAPHGKLRVPAHCPGYLEELETATPDLRWEGGRAHEIRRRAKALLAGEPPEPVAAPGRLRASLRPYQAQGLAWMQALTAQGLGGVLADDMGLGKTLQTIAHLCAEHEAGRLDRPALVVAPTSLVGNWKRELTKFAPHLRVRVIHGPARAKALRSGWDVDVVITTYPLLVRDVDAYEGQSFRLLVLDEAQTVKNPRSQVHQAARVIEADACLCLSGTPIENNLEELRAVFDLAVPGLLGDPKRFRARFRDPIERCGDAERLEQLRRRIAPFVLRRLKTLVAADLPPKTEIVRAVELSGEQRDLYEAIRVAAHTQVRQVIQRKGLAAATVDILGALMKLRQVCCDPRLAPVPEAGRVEHSAKLELLMEMVPEMLAQGRRILIFSQFTSMLALIGEALRERGIEHLALTGETRDRQGICDQFEGGRCDVLLLSLKAAGTGLNLTSADTVIHYDPWWNPAAQAQATDRAYRIGQTRPVFVYRLIAAGSVEERIAQLQERKQALADGLLGEGGDLGSFTQADVDDLFDPLDDAEPAAGAVRPGRVA
jgi:superfamily II DNA or RNA helicase